MSVQDNLEKVLRELHLLISKSEPYDKKPDSVVVDKKAMYELLNKLNLSIEDMKEAYEATKQSRDKAEREAKQRGEYIVKNANLKAEDVYAASVLYTDDALSQIQDIMKQASNAMEQTFSKFQEEMKEQREVVKDNQSELKSQLQDMADTKKYLNLIEEINKKREKEKAKQEQDGAEPKRKAIQNEGSIYAKPEIKINKEYFERNGIPLDLDEEEEKEEPEIVDLNQDDETDEKAKTVEPEISVNLDSEYFKWKNGEKVDDEEGKTEAKPGAINKLFSFGKKN